MSERGHSREEYLESLSVGELMEEVALETGATQASLTKGLLSERKRIHAMVANTEGKYRVLGVDTYDHEDWIDAEFGSVEETLKHVH